MPVLDLDTLLSPVPVPVFLDRYFGQSFLHVPGSAQKFSGMSVPLLAQELERALEAPIHVASGAEIPLHCPERDQILLQMEGKCDCRVGDPAAWEGLLEAGDALYVPRGNWISVGPGGARVSFDIDNPTGADVLDWIVEHVKQHPRFQADVPRFADPAAKADYAAGLRKALAQVLRAPGLLEGFRRTANLNAQPQPATGTPWSESAPDDRLIALLTPRRLRIKRGDQETILLVAMGKRLGFPEDAAPLLHFLSDRAPVPVAEFYNRFGSEFEREELSDLLSVLSTAGIIGLREPQSI